jgi:hypothetical protein
MKSPEFLSYVAGLFDGEGCVRFYKSECISITSCYPHHLLEIAYKFGYGKVKKVYDGDEVKKTAWRYELWGNNARAFLQEIRPYLREKAYQADIMLMIRLLPRDSLTRERTITELAKAKKVDYGF